MKLIRGIIRKKDSKKTDYCIFFYDGSCIRISENSEGQGFIRTENYFGFHNLEDAALDNLKVDGGELINWFQLPSLVQSAVLGLLEKEEK